MSEDFVTLTDRLSPQVEEPCTDSARFAQQFVPAAVRDQREISRPEESVFRPVRVKPAVAARNEVKHHAPADRWDRNAPLGRELRPAVQYGIHPK
jgi:hypothetical protein